MSRFKWFFILLLSISVLAGGSWIYRVHLIQSSLPYLLKDILKQAGVDVFQVELNDIDIDGAWLKTLSFEVDAGDSDGGKTGVKQKQTIKVSLHNIKLQYQYQSLLQGRLDKVVIDEVTLSDVTAASLSANSPAEILSTENSSIVAKESLKKTVSHENKTSLVLYQENINNWRNNWRSLIPVDALEVADINFQGSLFGALDKHHVELLFHGDEDNMHVDLFAGSVNKPHEIKISSHVKDEWTVSVGQSKTALLKLHLMDDAISVNYFFNAEKTLSFLKENQLANLDTVNVSALFHGKLKIFYNEGSAVNNKAVSSFVVQSEKIDVRGAGLQAIHLSNIDVNLAFQYKWLKDYKELTVQRKSHISFNQFDYADTQLKNTPLKLSGVLKIQPDKWFYDGGFTVTRLAVKQKIADKKISDQWQEVAFKNVSANIIADNKQLNVSGKFEPAIVSALISYKLSQQIVSGKGALVLHTDEPFNLSNEKSISQLLKPWVYPFDVFSGEIDLDTHLQWSTTKALQLTMKTQLKNVGGAFNQLVFSGLNTQQYLSLLPTIKTISLNKQPRVGQTGLIKLDYIDSGVLISDLNLQMVLSQSEQGSLPVLNVHNFNAELLGGHFHSYHFTLDFNQPVNHLSIQINNLDLSRIVKTQQFSDLEIEGMLDGELPIEINKEGVFVHEGVFYNGDRPGRIRYQPKSGVKQIAANPLTGIALKALRDFRYSKLKAGLTYVPDGTLSIGLEMNGISPELDKTRQVDLNINTEQNLKALLESIRYSQGLSDNIDKRVRNKFSATQ